jgi:ABC-2 type transport system ATP-binding protein
MSVAPLRLTGVTKRYGQFTAVRDLSFGVGQGEIVGFLGPNGAGKSTSLRMALGVIPADEGNVELFGAPPAITTLRRVGFLPEERGLYKKMTAEDTIVHFARLKGLDKTRARQRAVELLEATGLGPFRRSKISKLSKGMAQKVQILSTLAHAPDFLILDEPFSGLDPMNQQALEDLIRAEHQRGATILFSTHVMEHAERLCDRIVMLAKGRKMFDGTIEEGLELLGRAARLAVEPGFDLAVALAPKGFKAERAAAKGAGETWRVGIEKGRSANDVLRAAIEAGAPIISFTPEEGRLRDVFVTLAGEAEGALLDEDKTSGKVAA